MTKVERNKAIKELARDGWAQIESKLVWGNYDRNSYDVTAVDPKTGYQKRFSRLAQVRGEE